MQHPQPLEFHKLTVHYKDACFHIMHAAFEKPWHNIDDLFEHPNYKIFGVRHNDQLIAFIGISLVLAEVEILTCAVLPNYQRKGIGRFMLEQLLQTCAEVPAKRVFLEVDTTNAPAIGLYLQLGFSYMSTRKHYYKISDFSYNDAWVMVKDLP